MFENNESWWFFEDWGEDIEAEEALKFFEGARRVHKKQWNRIRRNYEYINAESSFLSAFWGDGDKHWCEECDDDL